MRLFATDRTRLAVAEHLVLALAVLGGLYLFARRNAPFLFDAEGLQSFVHGFGVWAPVAFVLLQVAQVLLAPVPGQILGFAAGYLFGTLWGTVYSVLGVTLGSALAMGFSRRFGRGYVERVVAPEALSRFDAVVADDGERGLFVLFLLPGIPDDVVCFLAGLTDVRLSRLVALAAVGRLPSYFLLALAGAELADAHVVEAALLVLGLFAASALVYWQRAALVRHLTAR